MLLAVSSPAAAAGPAADSGPIPCHFCGDRIQGNYIHYEGVDLNACSVCVDRGACRLCGLPLAGSNAGDDGHCGRCIGNAKRCASCGRPIFQHYWTVTGADGVYCEDCREAAPDCSSCGAPSRSVVRRDGRLLCDGCDQDRVTGDEGYQQVYEAMIVRARTKLGMTLQRQPPLIVESEGSLRSNPGLPSAHEGLNGLYMRNGRGDTSIHVISHLTASRAAAVLAHELAHAWQAEHCPEEQSPRLREGFAEWVAWHLLDGWEGGESERAIIAARTDEYGRGFHWYRELEASRGTEFALWWATAAMSTPAPDPDR